MNIFVTVIMSMITMN